MLPAPRCSCSCRHARTVRCQIWELDEYRSIVGGARLTLFFRFWHARHAPCLRVLLVSIRAGSSNFRRARLAGRATAESASEYPSGDWSRQHPRDAPEGSEKGPTENPELLVSSDDTRIMGTAAPWFGELSDVGLALLDV